MNTQMLAQNETLKQKLKIAMDKLKALQKELKHTKQYAVHNWDCPMNLFANHNDECTCGLNTGGE